MEWQIQEQQQQDHEQSPNVVGGSYVKVMTDEQIERLRQQIVVYASICEQLVQMHRSFAAQQDFAGGRLGNLYCDPLMATCGRKMTSRHRWAPTPGQLEILERVFNEGNVAPKKQKVKEITAELRQHGQISEANAYNWFQNRRARWKRKQLASITSNTEAVKTLVESPEDDKTRALGTGKS